MLEQSQEADDHYKAAVTFLDNLDHWERTGRVPRTLGQWVFVAVVSSLVGLFVGICGNCFFFGRIIFRKNSS